MFLKSLILTNFRNYSKINFQFKKPITVFIGDNAQGKTNFLEGIYYLASAKSFRAEKEDELIKQGENILRIEGEITNDEEVKLEVVILNEAGVFKKKVRVNGIPKRVFDYSSQMAIVMFSPEDINLVTGSPSLRRSHIDQVVSQVDRDYKRTINSYEELITKKNKVLKRIREGRGRKDELVFWSDQQLLLGTLITEKRKSFFEYLNTVERTFGEVSFKYIENEITSPKLNDYQAREIEAATSLIGPHRDDFIFVLDGIDLSKFGSRGEQRTAVLDLKMAEVSFIENVLHRRPVLLLDDIFSELDHEHMQHVISLSDLQQTIISSVEWDKYLEDALKGADIYQINQGSIKKF